MGGPAAQARPPVGPVNDGGGKPPPYGQGNGRRVKDAAPYDSGPSPPARVMPSPFRMASSRARIWAFMGPSSRWS